MKKELLITGLLATLISPAFAEGNGFYIGANIGKTDVDSGSYAEFILFPLPSEITESIDNDDTGYSINAGYNFNQYISIDASYIDLGEFSHSVEGGSSRGMESTSINGVTVGATGSLPLSENFKLYAKAGYLFWDLEEDFTETTPNFHAEGKYKAKNNDVFYGVGAAYIIGKTELSLDYTFYAVEKIDIDLFSLGLKFNF